MNKRSPQSGAVRASEGEPDVEKGLHQNLRRILAIVDLLAGASVSGLRAIDVANASGLGRATAHRILNGLVSHGVAEYEEESSRYFIGPKVIEWSFAALNRNGLAQASAAILEELATVTRDTVYLMVRSGTQAYCIDCRDGDFPIRTRVVDPGGALELDQSALGLAILAHIPPPGLVISDAQQRVMNEVTAVRQSGYAMDTGASARGVTVLAAPIRSATGTAIASVGLSAISTRLDEARCVYVGKQLVQAAREIERRAHQRIW